MRDDLIALLERTLDAWCMTDRVPFAEAAADALIADGWVKAQPPGAMEQI